MPAVGDLIEREFEAVRFRPFSKGVKKRRGGRRGKCLFLESGQRDAANDVFMEKQKNKNDGQSANNAGSQGQSVFSVVGRLEEGDTDR
jgi:hypothetical protein